MEPADVTLLREMREAIDAYRANSLGIGRLADKLLLLRDRLRFRDASWAHDVTQHIATLDSASTFTPKDDTQAAQLAQAVNAAVASLLQLIGNKIA